MQKILKTCTIIAVFSVFIFNILVVNALPFGNKTSFSVGARYSDGDSTGPALYASNSYWDMGIRDVILLQAPTISALKGSHSNGVKYLQSGIVFITGHAGVSHFEFPNRVWITQDNTNGTESVGIGTVDNSKTALYVMAGCNTASNGDDNITNYVVNRGAKISIGWKTELNQASFVNWNKRFHDRIKNKIISVENAATEASNYIYLNNNVKNWKTYGSKTNNPWDFINNTTNTSIPVSALSQNTNEHLVKDKINSLGSTGNIVGENAVKELVGEFIKTKLDVTFNTSDYVIEINGDDTKYYDFVLYVDGIRTSIGYTAVQDEEGEIKLFDNRNNYDINNIKSIVSSLSYKINDSVRTKSSSQALQKANLEGFNNSNIVKKDGSGYYEVETGKLYYATTLEIKTASGATSTDTYLMEIK